MGKRRLNHKCAHQLSGADINIIADLPKGQRSGELRHTCPVCAFVKGVEEGVQRERKRITTRLTALITP